MLIGLAIGRCDLTAVVTLWRMVVGGAVVSAVGYGGGWLATFIAADATPDGLPEVAGACWRAVKSSGSSGSADVGDFPAGCVATDVADLLTARPHSGSTFEILGSGGLAVAVIGLVLLLTRARVASVVLWPAAALGSMPLTAYVLHALSMTYLPEVDNLFLWSVVVGLVVATIWSLVFARGPLERGVSWVATRSAHSVTAGGSGTRGRLWHRRRPRPPA
jgi:hypothetical protein